MPWIKACVSRNCTCGKYCGQQGREVTKTGVWRKTHSYSIKGNFATGDFFSPNTEMTKKRTYLVGGDR